MKIQCTCGAKYAFEVTAEMAQAPVKLVCQGCGLDLSDFVNDLIRQELGLAPSAANPAVATPAPPVETAPEPIEAGTVPPPPSPRLRISGGTPRGEEAATATAAVLSPCPKHPDRTTTDQCRVCQKPICPKCMEVFGYVCSAYCRARAESQGIDIPVYAGQKSVAEARRWRNAGRITWAASVAIVAALGLWFWYAWFGSKPKPVFSAKFTEPAYSGQIKLCDQDQIVVLHGGTLARYDLKQKKEVWSADLIDPKAFEGRASASLKAMQAAHAKAVDDGADDRAFRLPTADELVKGMVRSAAAALELRVAGRNVWVVHPGQLARYDWDTGKPAQEIALHRGQAEVFARNGEFLVIEPQPGRHVVTRVNLTNGELRTEEIGELAPTATTAEAPAKTATSQGREMAGLPVGAADGTGAGEPLDPAKVAQQAQGLSAPARIALPAVLAVNRNQERALAEMKDAPPSRPQATSRSPAASTSLEESSWVPGKNGLIEFSVRLLEQRLVARKAMKEPPKKSALDGAVNVGATAEVANEILNDMQRDRGGATVTEDESRYRVALRQPGASGAADWTGEVIGKPSLYPLETVTVLAGARTIQVFDRMNRPLWQATLNFRIPESRGPVTGEASPFGAGPCVERADTLYVFDQGVLTAFELASGNVRWRLPSVGVAGLFFDDAGMLYVNSTTASPETIKYSRQIDITRITASIVVKMDPRTGKTLWTAQPGGLLSCVSGKFIFVIHADPGNVDDEGNGPYPVQTGFEKLPFVRIERLNPRNGRMLWAHFQQRMPLDVEFDGNTICLVFKNEVQVLKFLSF